MEMQDTAGCIYVAAQVKCAFYSMDFTSRQVG